MAEMLGLDEKHVTLSEDDIVLSELTVDDLLSRKKEVIRLLSVFERKLADASIEYNRVYNNAMINTLWDSVIDGKITDTVKKSYCQEQSNSSKRLMKEFEADVHLLENSLDLVNDMLEFKFCNGGETI